MTDMVEVFDGDQGKKLKWNPNIEYKYSKFIHNSSFSDLLNVV